MQMLRAQITDLAESSKQLADRIELLATEIHRTFLSAIGLRKHRSQGIPAIFGVRESAPRNRSRLRLAEHMFGVAGRDGFQ